MLFWAEGHILVADHTYSNLQYFYSQVPIKQVGPNKRVGWMFYVNFLKQVGPNKQVGWWKKAVNLKQVGLILVEFQKIVPNKQVVC